MPRDNRWRLTWLLPVAICLHAAPLSAQAVGVQFVTGDPFIKARLGTGLASTEREMTQWIADKVATAFPYWDYTVTAPPPGTRLDVTLGRTGQKKEIVVTLVAPGASVPPWRVAWIDDAEVQRLGGLPAPDGIVTLIRKAFETELLQARQGEILAQFFKVLPLARDAQLAVADTPKAVLPLGWKRHRPLAMSKFQLMYQTDGGVVTVLCTGVGTTRTYPAPPPASGLEVNLNTFMLGGAEQPATSVLPTLASRRPFAIYLTAFDAAGFGLPDEDPNEASVSFVPAGPRR